MQPADHLDGLRIVIGEVPRNTDEPGIAPVDRLCTLGAELLLHQALELVLMIKEPRQVRECLTDHVLIARALVLHDDRRPVLVQPERIDPAAMSARRVLGG